MIWLTKGDRAFVPWHWGSGEHAVLCHHGLVEYKGCDWLPLRCRQTKGPDNEPVYEPCAPSERGAVEATLTQLAEKGLASQVMVHQRHDFLLIA